MLFWDRRADSNSLATLVYAVVNSRIDYCNTVLAGAPWTVTDKLQRVLNAAVCVVTGTWKFDSGLGQILHDELHWLDVPDRAGVFQAGSDSSPVSERPRTAVPVGLLRSGRRCRHSAAPAFRQPSTTCSTSLPAVGPFQLPAPKSGTLSQISSETRP